MTSSLGVGDAEDLSRKLTDILSLIPEKEESENAGKCEQLDLKTPPVKKRVPRKPKLMIEELAIRTVRKMPKITITEESPTPRKFFKSKDKVNLENSPPNMVTPTIQAPASIRQARIKSKSSTPDEYSIEAAGTQTVSRSLKNIGKIQIFDDSQFKTPVKSSQNITSTATKRSSRKALPVIGETDTPAPAASSSTKKTTRSSARKTAKTSEEVVTEVPSREGSVRKSSRKTKTEEPITPTVGTRSSRRALNRL